MEFQQRFKAFPLEKALDINLLKEMGLKFGLVYHLDEVLLKRVEDIKIVQECLIEARFFNEEKEIHIFRRDDLEAVLFEESSEGLVDLQTPIKEEYFIVQNDIEKRIGKRLGVKSYILFDEDKQAYIGYTRPYSVTL